MKNSITLFFLFCSILTQAQLKLKDITNDKTVFDSVLNEGKKQDKLVFIYFTAQWCIPCKQFEREVFTNDSVMDFYSKNFINTEVIWVKQKPFLNEKYDINGFPQFLFINQAGEVIHHGRYYMDKQEFLKVGRQAISRDDNMRGWQQRIHSGDYSYDIVAKYLNTLERPSKFQDSGFKCEAQKVLDNYFSTQDSNLWINKRNWFLTRIYISNPHSPQFEYVMRHFEQYVKEYSKMEVDRYIFDTWESYTSGCMDCSDRYKNANIEIKQIDFPPVKAIVERKSAWRIFDVVQHEECTQKKDSLALQLYLAMKQPFTDFYYLYPAYQINDWTWYMFEFGDKTRDTLLLRTACVWMDKLSGITDYFEVFDTYSHLLSAIGDHAKALQMEEEALKFAMKSNETEQIINRINDRINKLKNK